MNTPQTAAIALAQSGRYISRTDYDTLSEYLVALPNGCRYIVIQWDSGIWSAEPELTYV